MGFELFQQFVPPGEKPLKRLDLRGPSFHRAEAAVLMRGLVEGRHIGARVLERLSGLTVEGNDYARQQD